MASVYMSGALTGINEPDKIRKFYEDIGLLCRRLNMTPYIPHMVSDPVTHQNLDPRRVFEIDKTQVKQADLVIAYLGIPSFGVGMELAYAEGQAIPIILLYEENKSISRFARGIPTIIAEISFNHERDAFEKLETTLKAFLETMPSGFQ